MKNKIKTFEPRSGANEPKTKYYDNDSVSLDTSGIRKECAVVFREIAVTLKLIKKNDLAHIHADIKDIRGWIRATALVGLTAAASVVTKVLFF